MPEVDSQIRDQLEIKEDDVLSQVMILNEISSILYQVTDFDTALDMILDTCTEYLKIPKAGIIKEDPTTGDYSIIKSRNLSSDIEEKLHFKLTDKLNEQTLSLEKRTGIDVINSCVEIGIERKINFENINLFISFR